MTSTRETRVLVRVAGVFALLVGATQLGGNALHPPMPRDPIEAMDVINDAGGWRAVHLVIAVSYFCFIPFVIGAVAAFRAPSALVRLATPLVVVGAALGVAQILTHLTIFHDLAEDYTTASPALQPAIANTFEVFWQYSVALEVAHLLAIFLGVLLFGVAMLGEPAFRRWVAWLGIVAGAVATVGIVVGKFVIEDRWDAVVFGIDLSRAGDLVFGISLVPLLVWIFAVGITLLRMPIPAAEPGPQPAVGRASSGGPR